MKVLLITALAGATLISTAHAKEYNWGAISVDIAGSDRSPYYGIGGGATKSEAVTNAQNFCKEAGGTSCQSLTTYESCGSVAVSTTKYGYGTGATKTIARDAAMAMCAEDGCKVAATDCN